MNGINYELINSLLYCVIVICVSLAFWHYAVPKDVKKEAKKIVGGFLKYVIYGIRPDGTRKPLRKSKKKPEKNVKGELKVDKKDERIKELEDELLEIKKTNKQKQEKKQKQEPKKEPKDVNKEIAEHQKKTKEIMKDLF
jgi:predicted nucleotidyltransferase